MKDKIGGKIIKEFVLLKAKTYSYLKGNNGEDKKAKGTNNCVRKIKPKPRDYKNCLEVTQLESKITRPEEDKLNVDNLKEHHKEFVKNNNLILKPQQQFRRKKKMCSLKKIKRRH